MQTNQLVKTTIINGKKYTVEHVFNMVGNWHFTDKHGTIHLVDGEDVSLFATQQGLEWDGVNTAIAYAKHYASEVEDGTFWWKIK